jgi:dihydroflavonol-4-reductase
MKTVLITGGTGFIGSNLAAKLVERGITVRILRRPQSDPRAIVGTDVKHCQGDLRDLPSLKEAMKGCDTVFHTAAMVSFERRKREEQYVTNVLGTRNVVEACLATGIRRLVHTSSVAAIGYPEEGQLATEETTYNWGTHYGYKYSKHLAELEIHEGIRRGLDAVIVNPSVVLGERDVHFHGGQLIRDIKKGRVPFYIDGGMNVVYVGDVAEGLISAAQKGKKGERYVVCGENLTHREIFRRTAALVGGRAPIAKLSLSLLRISAKVIESVSAVIGVEPLITSDLISGAGRNNWYSCAKAKRELGYTVTPFDETIVAAYRWYREHGLLK